MSSGYVAGPNGTYRYAQGGGGGEGGGGGYMNPETYLAHMGLRGLLGGFGQGTPDYGAAGPVMGSSIAGYGGAIGGAMNQIAGVNAANQQAGLSQQQMMVPLQMAHIQQQGLNQRLGMLAPIFAKMFGGGGAGGMGGGGSPGFSTMYGQYAMGGGGGAGGAAGGGQGGVDPSWLYRTILAQRQANEVNLNSIPGFTNNGVSYAA